MNTRFLTVCILLFLIDAAIAMSPILKSRSVWADDIRPINTTVNIVEDLFRGDFMNWGNSSISVRSARISNPFGRYPEYPNCSISTIFPVNVPIRSIFSIEGNCPGGTDDQRRYAQSIDIEWFITYNLSLNDGTMSVGKETQISTSIALHDLSEGTKQWVYATPEGDIRTIQSFDSPQLDLHAYTEDGLHTGMNYEKGFYENMIPGAIASGDMVMEEWIFVPKTTKVKYVVYSRELVRFLNDNESRAMGYSLTQMDYGEHPSVAVENGSVIIKDRVVHDSINGTIRPGENQTYISNYTQEAKQETSTTSSTLAKTKTLDAESTAPQVLVLILLAIMLLVLLIKRNKNKSTPS